MVNVPEKWNGQRFFWGQGLLENKSKLDQWYYVKLKTSAQ
jgi:hypothetical protein